MAAWEELDTDDSDLPFLLRPCTFTKTPLHLPPFPQTLIPSPTTTATPLPSPPSPPPPPRRQRLIPGPAGLVQAAMIRKRARGFLESEPVVATQEFIRRAVESVEELYEEDDDFKADSWIRALELLYLRQSGCEEFVVGSTPLSLVKEGDVKVDQVVAIIKSCTPNGFGDLMVTLKDPTGTIDATIHRKVLSESEFAKEISVSSVVILEKVSVFSPPSGKTLYLNITKTNLVKVFGKDAVPLERQNHPAPKIVYAPTSDGSGKMRMLQTTFFQELGRTEEYLNEESDISQVANARGSRNFNNQKEKANPFQRTVDNNKRSAGVIEALRARQGAPAKEIIDEAVKMDVIFDDQVASDSNEKHPTSANLCDRLQSDSASANLVEDCSEVVQRINKLQKHIQPVLPKASIPQWTDEQLNELFADDFDDEGSLFR